MGIVVGAGGAVTTILRARLFVYLRLPLAEAIGYRPSFLTIGVRGKLSIKSRRGRNDGFPFNNDIVVRVKLFCKISDCIIIIVFVFS